MDRKQTRIRWQHLATPLMILSLHAAGCGSMPEEGEAPEEALGIEDTVVLEQAVETNSPEGIWTAEYNGTYSKNDSSGNGHHALSSSSPFYYVTGYPNVYYGFQFTGDDWIEYSNIPGNFGQSNFTISFAIKTKSTGLRQIINKRPACTYGTFFDIRIQNGTIGVELYDGTTNLSFNTGTTKKYNDNLWHLVKIQRVYSSYYGRYYHYLYVDNTLVTTVTSTRATNLNNTARFKISAGGCVHVDGTMRFEGVLDNIVLSTP